MSKGTKTALWIVGGLVGLCICVGAIALVGFYWVGQQVSESIVEEPAQVREVATGMVDYELPPGLSEQFGMSFFGLFDMVSFSDEANKLVIMMMQFSKSAGVNQAQMEQQMEEQMQQRLGRQNLDLQTVDTIETTIRDQAVTLTVREGSDEEGESMRQLSGVFTGKGGPVLLMVMAPQENWNQESIDAFIASLR
jgi:hypothetical protein